MTVTYKPMAVVQSSFKDIPGMPIQLAGAPSAQEEVHTSARRRADGASGPRLCRKG